ncbi:MAG: hypothetical protein COS92_01130 [Desulfobacterales bacterium CG07_land_8_20_14_0_80_52_14]|nr:MAG: hypothetical protein COX20_12015 [Desulfobacterales bacterium CG23_combo_of_CG06-09_8_20_14_all_52_9]PIU50507.1 MAG: hypothetical protein COS92_01130 [Desulfobacterales bacterium CG07_land_8_20_14_0_80_52_14]
MKAFKDQIARLLESDPFENGLSQILKMPPRRAINPLLSFLYSTREEIRWRAITAIGALVADQADTDLEGARVVMRRLIWSLNDESGGIGWGSAEAMGEICAKSERLACEFVKILVSYIDPKCNFIGNETLQRGLLWGIGRIAQVRPERIAGTAKLLIPFLGAADPVLRGLAAWAASSLKDPLLAPYLAALSEDASSITLFINAEPKTYMIKDLPLT